MDRNLAKRLKAGFIKSWDQGVFADILSRLPVKVICSFKAVCKRWLDGLTSDSYFAKKQLAHSRENPSFILCPNNDTRVKLFSMRPKSLEPLNPNFTDFRSGEYHIISSFNGLICCINPIDAEKGYCDLQIWIRNPCTGDTLLLPQGRPSFEVEPTVGVAYASDNSDYKVFRLFRTEKKIPFYVDYQCEVYSSSTGSWEHIGPVPYFPLRATLSPHSSHVFVDGKVYWLVSCGGPGEEVIISVDLEGTFGFIDLPQYLDGISFENEKTDGPYLIVLQGSLAFVVIHVLLRSMDIWCLKEEEEEDEWEHHCEDEIPIPFSPHEFSAVTSRGNEVVFVTTDSEWCIYDVDKFDWQEEMLDEELLGDEFDLWEEVMGPRAPAFMNPYVFPFTESVLTCNGGVEL